MDKVKKQEKIAPINAFFIESPLKHKTHKNRTKDYLVIDEE
jgi:hypothetical protein